MLKGRVCSYKKEKKNISNVLVSKKQKFSFDITFRSCAERCVPVSKEKKQGMER
jgi:hypothetical protein